MHISNQKSLYLPEKPQTQHRPDCDQLRRGGEVMQVINQGDEAELHSRATAELI
jgi:hypothetical protein